METCELQNRNHRPITGSREGYGDATMFPAAEIQFPSAINPERDKIFFCENNFWSQLSLSSGNLQTTFKFGDSNHVNKAIKKIIPPEQCDKELGCQR